ncbi:MAG: Protein cbp3, mitochondrial, partial [Bathelium mastoideum]
LGLTPTFNTWAQITMLYMYALTVRLRCLPASEFALFQQHLNNACFAAAEHRMISLHRINLSGMRQRYLKDLFGQWRGVSVAYDEGLIRGDAVLATAIWRNIFKADQDVDVEKVAAVTSYLRRLLRMLDKMGDAQIRRVVIQWPGLEQEEVLVRAESPQLKAPFVETAKV